jgi:hypothetical protein
VLLFGTLAFASRLAFLVHQYGVNLFFSDQWEFNDSTVFQQHTLWQIFRWQHAWHRQGLGGLTSAFFGPLTRWSTVADSYLILFLLCIATFLAIRLKQQITGSLSLFDLAIPAILLSPSQFESLILDNIFAYSVYPVLLLILMGLAWQIRSPGRRLLSIVTINCFAVSTGFTLFLAAITPLFIIIDYVFSKGVPKPSRTQLAMALTACILTIAFFLKGYHVNADLDCFSPQSHSPSQYLSFVTVMFADFWALRDTGFVGHFVGTLMLVALGVLFLQPVRTLIRRSSDTSGSNCQKQIVPILFIIFSIVLCFSAAYGRLCGGIQMALAYRYFLYLEPAILGAYFIVATLSPRRTRFSVPVIACGLIAASLFRDPTGELSYFKRNEEQWISCFRQYHAVDTCNRVTGFAIYGHAPEKTHLQEKLLFIESKKLNYFADHRSMTPPNPH